MLYQWFVNEYSFLLSVTYSKIAYLVVSICVCQCLISLTQEFKEFSRNSKFIIIHLYCTQMLRMYIDVCIYILESSYDDQTNSLHTGAHKIFENIAFNGWNYFLEHFNVFKTALNKMKCRYFLISSIYIWRKFWIRDNFRHPVFDGFTCFENTIWPFLENICLYAS